MTDNPDREFVDELIDVFREGAHLGIDELPEKSLICPNNLSARKQPTVVDELLQKEITQGYLIGPFPEPPFDVYRINPLSVAHKKYAEPPKPRLVVDYSSPHDNEEHSSLNDLISKEKFSLTYTKIDEAIQIIQNYGQKSWLCKTDLSDAFKQVPVHPKYWAFQGIKWRNQYYFYTRLVFGSRSSPKIFDNLSRAIVWIAKHKYGIDQVLHLLYDFLTIDRPSFNAHRTMALLTLILNKLKIPYSLKKTMGPLYVLEYLGLILDTLLMQCRLPADKLDRMIKTVAEYLDKKECTKREMLSLCGSLSFATRVIPIAKSFMFRLFKVAHSKKNLDATVTISKTAKGDLVMWQHFLSHWNGISLFIDNDETTSPSMHLFTDASGFGHGGIFGNSWFYGEFPEDVLKRLTKKASIAFKELYPIVIAAVLFGKSWSRKRIVLHCDNKGVVGIVKKGYSKSEDIMRLMRRLTLVAAYNSFSLTIEHVKGMDNKIADCISRFKFQEFRRLAPYANEHPCKLPPLSEIMFG